jgi:hypothetical protein
MYTKHATRKQLHLTREKKFFFIQIFAGLAFYFRKKNTKKTLIIQADRALGGKERRNQTSTPGGSVFVLHVWYQWKHLFHLN